MALTVVVRSGDLKTPAEISFDAPRVVIGRSPGCEVELPDPSVSHRHASIRQRGTDYVIVDEGSSNGTFVGPVRLSPQAPRVLRTGDLIRVGRVWLEIKIQQVPITQHQKLATREIALSLVASAITADGRPAGACIKVSAGPDTGATLVVADAERSYVIGRGPGLDLSLKDEELSRRHIEITRRGYELCVRDLRSKNGAAIGDTPLEPDKEVSWPMGSVLKLGDTELVYDDPVRSALDELGRVSDERIPEHESIAAPVGAAPELAPQKRETESVRPAPSRKPSAPPAAGRSGVTWVDIAVGILAVSVLVLSLVGLWLLFGA